MEAPKVYEAIARCIYALSREGITKSRKNSQQGYTFRGIDDIYNALAPVLAANALCVIPRVISREVTERQTKAGSTLFYVVVDVEFDLVCAADGSRHTAKVSGEAMDSADKATNKAMSAAYKYLALQLFCIPTEGDNDADAVTHVVVTDATLPGLLKAAQAAAAGGMVNLKDWYNGLEAGDRESVSKSADWQRIKASANKVTA